ncbi:MULTISPECIES: CsbD family protein [Corynebacterium]|uniref:CsbD family protein n=1 Tax=Corynebacterium TaxID=1716 RepID=UPI0018843385|nr:MULTISPECIES: CsbD family protein [Corynebacterium]MBF0580847.1 CsbD family protein [Corynebacterium sp. ED61]
MSTDELKNKAEGLGGKAKEAAGSATGNEQLENEGRADQTVAGAKEKANEAKNKIADGVNKVLGDAGEK